MEVSSKPKLLQIKTHEVLRDFSIAGTVGIVILLLLPTWIRCVSMYVGGIIFLANVIYTFVANWKPKGRIEIGAKAVVISGCDSGFGSMLAQRLDDKGFHVFAGCLFPEGDGAKELKKSASNRLHIFQLDVTRDDDVAEAVKYVTDNLGSNKLWAVVCNAGLNDGGDLNWTDMDTIKKVMDVNLFGVVRVTKAFLPQICEAKGRIVAVASAAGRYTYPGIVPYSMSKHGLVSFCDGLRLEMSYKWGIQVITVEPYMYKTNITQDNNVAQYKTRTWDRAPEVVKKMYPNNYIQNYIKSSLKFLRISISDKVSEVIDCLEEAVTARNPKYAYSPGTVQSRMTYWLLSRLPKPIADLFIIKSHTGDLT